MDRDDVRWKVEALKRAGFGTGVRPDPMRQSDPLTGGLKAEMRAERAAAYGRAIHKVEQAIALLDAAGAALQRAAEPALASARTTWRARRDEALHARWELAVHRDALGLVHQGSLEDQFPIAKKPPR